MGRRGGGQRGNRGRGGRGGGGGGSSSGWKGAPRPNVYRWDKVVIEKSNERFEQYYNELLQFSDDDERKEFWEALRRDLPNSFRFTGSKGHALTVQRHLIEHYIPEITKIDWEGKKVEPPSALPWYPDQLAWQMTTPKNIIRRFPPFKAFQQFLVSETTVGNISRQEAVSMIPPLLLDVQPGHIVLDLCAAPGSKSAQLIEAVHAGEESRLRKVAEEARGKQDSSASKDDDEMKLETEDPSSQQDNSDDGRATGLLIANDVDYKRAHMLIHQMKRLNSPNLVVTNHDATLFPSIKLPTPKPTSEAPRPPNRYLKFDRILADVPCSGDGTTRKNFPIWKDWTPGNALGLHTTQVKILVRALQMLKVGGRAVYSTCSMNPVENEAVVATAIQMCGGLDKVAILDPASTLPALKYKQGLKQWKVMDKEGRIWSSFEDVESHSDQHGASGLGRVSTSMFPPPPEMPLERCIRIEPHLQDTGGFFICLLKKKTEIKARPEPARTVSQIQAQAEAKDETTNPGLKMPSISEIVKEIDSKVPDANGAIDHIKSLDALAPPAAQIEDDGNMSAAARSNTELPSANDKSSTGIKRTAEELPFGAGESKRARTDQQGEQEDGAAPRREHWPPPPASRPDVELAHAAAETAQAVNHEESARQPRPQKNRVPFEEPYKYLDPNLPELEEVYSFYGLDPRFPRDRFMVRNSSGEPVRSIYYTSALARDILTENEGKGIKFVHGGVKMFVKQDVQREDQCAWRIQTDGLQLIESWVSDDRVVNLTSRKALHRLLKELYPKVDGGGWRELGEVGERIRDIGLGCGLVRVEAGQGEDAFSERMVLPLWRSLFSANLMLPKEDRKALLLRLYNDNSEIIDHQKNRKSQKQAAASSEGPRASASKDDPPPPGESLLVNQRAADLEEVAENFGSPSDDDDDADDEANDQGGVKLKPDEAEQDARLQLQQEEGEGIREGGVETADKEEVREMVTGVSRDGPLFAQPDEQKDA